MAYIEDKEQWRLLSSVPMRWMGRAVGISLDGLDPTVGPLWLPLLLEADLALTRDSLASEIVHGLIRLGTHDTAWHSFGQVGVWETERQVRVHNLQANRRICKVCFRKCNEERRKEMVAEDECYLKKRGCK